MHWMKHVGCTLDKASIAPSMWFTSLLSRQLTRACNNSGQPKTPPSCTTTLTMVPTVDLICLSAAPRQGNNSDFIYCWFTGAMDLNTVLRLFFKSRPAACRISTDLPCSGGQRVKISVYLESTLKFHQHTENCTSLSYVQTTTKQGKNKVCRPS